MNRNDPTDYRLIARDDEGDGPWEECSFCGYPAPLAEFGRMIEPRLKCRLCANILPAFDPDQTRVQKAVLHAANAILAVLTPATEQDDRHAEGQEE